MANPLKCDECGGYMRLGKTREIRDKNSQEVIRVFTRQCKHNKFVYTRDAKFEPVQYFTPKSTKANKVKDEDIYENVKHK